MLNLVRPPSAESMTKARAAISISLRPIKRATIEIKVCGDSLIVHAWSEKAVKEMLTRQQISKEEKRLLKNNRAKKDPAADYEGAKYHDAQGWDAFPSTGFKKAMVDAGFMLGIPRPAIRAAVFVIGEYVPIAYKKVVMREDAVRVGPYNKREADLRYRPDYIDWSATLRIEYRQDVFTAEQVAALVQNAGFSIGVGEWRPQKEGQHGRFDIVTE